MITKHLGGHPSEWISGVYEFVDERLNKFSKMMFLLKFLQNCYFFYTFWGKASVSLIKISLTSLVFSNLDI